MKGLKLLLSLILVKFRSLLNDGSDFCLFSMSLHFVIGYGIGFVPPLLCPLDSRVGSDTKISYRIWDGVT